MNKKLMIAALLVSATMAFAEGKTQTTCPVMKGNPVNKSLYVDADGCRLYVCCGGCIGAVKADPAKYVAQLKAEGIELEKTPESPAEE